MTRISRLVAIATVSKNRHAVMCRCDDCRRAIAKIALEEGVALSRGGLIKVEALLQISDATQARLIAEAKEPGDMTIPIQEILASLGPVPLQDDQVGTIVYNDALAQGIGEALAARVPGYADAEKRRLDLTALQRAIIDAIRVHDEAKAQLWWRIRGVGPTDERALCRRCGRTGQAHWRLWGCWRFKARVGQ